jgi:8-oxo-dGTP diphosphatase
LYRYEHPRPAVTVDIVLFRQTAGATQVLLIKRAGDPYRGYFALPGGFLDSRETLEQAALRELQEETGLTGIPLIQIHTFSGLDRDPRGWVISTAFSAVIVDPIAQQVHAGSDAEEANWFDIQELPDLAFDHQLIIQTAASKLGVG